jgi:lysophospholipase L1-like esterase
MANYDLGVAVGGTNQQIADAIKGVVDSGLFGDDIATQLRINNSKSGRHNIAFCGDSITENGGAGRVWYERGHSAWLRRFIGTAADCDIDNVFAVGGMGTNHLVNTQLPLLLASGATVVYTLIGTNDVALGDTADTIANLETYYNAVFEAGIIAFSIPVLPRGDYAAGGVSNKEIDKINNWLRARARTSKHFYYLGSVLDAVTTYDSKLMPASIRFDDVHPNSYGAYLIGKSEYNLTSWLYHNLGMSASAQTYIYNDVGYSNVLANNHLIGTGGTLKNAASGIAPSLWSLNLPTGTTQAVTGSRVAYGDIGDTRFNVAMTGNADGVSTQISTTISLPTDTQVGDVYDVFMTVDITKNTGLLTVALQASNVNGYADGGFADTGHTDYIKYKHTGLLTYSVSLPIVDKSQATFVTIFLRPLSDASTLDANVILHNVSMIKRP